MRQNQFTQITHVCFRPAGLSGVAVAVAQQKAQQLLFRPLHHLHGIRAAAADIADHLVLHVGNVNAFELAGPVQTGQFTGIPAIGLDAVTRLRRDL